MKRAYLGDSYDAVKRMWQELFADWAPLYAAPRFLPADLRQDFTRLTKVPVLHGRPARPFSILNDPDVGIRLPAGRNQAGGRKHISIETIIQQLRLGVSVSTAPDGWLPECVITFDQSFDRNRRISVREQRRAKMQSVALQGFHSFYYVSHAPFLFVLQNVEALQRIRRILKDAGIPEGRIEEQH